MGRLGEGGQLLIRLADELDAEAERAVEKQERADELARFITRLASPEHPGEDCEQDDALKRGFVKLARVARRTEHLTERSHLDEPDRPGDSRRGTPQFLIHEIGEAAEEQAEGHATGDIIVDAKPRQLLLAREIQDAERRADDAAVKRHAAIPQLQNFDRMAEILPEIVEQHVAEAAAEENSERAIESE